MSVGRVTVERSVRCRAPREHIWDGIANTERVNRYLGNSALELTPLAPERLEPYEQRTTIGGLSLTYTEEPYRFEAGRWFSCRRVMSGGPAAEVDIHYELSDTEEGGTLVLGRYVTLPRNYAVAPVVWLVSRQTIARWASFVELLDSEQSGPRSLRGDAPLLRELRSRARPLLAAHGESLVERLLVHLANAEDADVWRIRPYELAERWGVSRRSLLQLCLAAVSAGLLELSWSILCPSCRGPAETLQSLSELDRTSHCNVCDLRWTVDLGRVVEVTFRAHPKLRVAPSGPFCIGGPRLMPHVLCQEIVREGAAATLRAPAVEGRYRLFAKGGASTVVAVQAGAAAEQRLALAGDAFSAPELEVAPGGTLLVHGDSRPRQVKLERVEWLTVAATAHDVTLLPEFRAQFGKEALRPGLGLSVGRVAILFSDLVGSTALYSKVGDAAAFGVVTDALNFGRVRVERHGGTVVKTMGDAIMAAFSDVREAYAAAAEMLVDWAAFADAEEPRRELDLKIGIWDGPCTAVSANDTLDYFGQTVNTAARVQHLAGARELVVAEAAIEQLESLAGLVPTEHFARTVKGIAEPLPLVRLTLSELATR